MTARARRVFGLLLPLLMSSLPARAQDLPVLPPLEEEPLVEPPQVEPPPYPVEQLEPMPPMQSEPLRLRQPEPAPVDESLFTGGGIAIQGGLGGSSQILLSFNAGAALFGLGLSLGYDQQGVSTGAVANAASTGSMASSGGSSDTIAFQLATYFAYMAYNTKPLAFGPEVDFEAQLAPGTPFNRSTLIPGFAMWYEPFHAPLQIGTMIGLRIGFAAYGNPTVSTDYPGVRLRWAF